MIKFNDGKTSNSYPYFTGTVCTIYDTPPNTSGFFYEGLDCSDFHTLYRQGEGYYQLSNDGRVCEDETEKVKSLEEISQMEKEIEQYKAIEQIKKEIAEVKEELASTDYIIIKMAEGLDVSEYDMKAVKASRQQLRDEVNVLEMKLQNISQE